MGRLIHWVDEHDGPISGVHFPKPQPLLSLKVLWPGVLYFLRDPTDPNYNPFRNLIDDPIHKHARRVLLSVVVYASLIVMLVFLPVRLAILMAPSMFPLDIRVSVLFTEIPRDMLLFHICIPFAVEHFRPRATLKAGLFHWFLAVGWALGLCEFLLPGPVETNANNNEQERGHKLKEGQVDSLDTNHVQGAAVNEPRVDNVNTFREEFAEYVEEEEESANE